MKIVFKTLQSIDGVIQLSLDGGKNWTKYSILTIKEDGGIPIPEDQDLSLIKIKSDSTTLNNLEVLSSIKAENSVDVSNIDSLNINRQVFNKKKLNYRDSIFNIMFAMQVYNLIEENSVCIAYNRDILNNLDLFEDDIESITMFKNILKSNIKAFGMSYVDSEESYSSYGYTFNNAINGEQVKQDNVEIIYETIEHYEDALKNSSIIQLIKETRDDFEELASPYELLDGESVKYPHMVYRDGKYYDVTYTRENNDINIELNECELIKDKQFLIFFDDIITGIKTTIHPELNLNGTTINFKSTTDFVEMDLDNVNKFIHKYDSENNIFYTLFATTNNENIPDEFRYSMHVYLNYADSDSDLSGMPVDIWYNKDDPSNTEIYSFNFEFNDNIEDYIYYFQNDDNIWTTDDEGNNFAYALTSADKKGYKFIKDSSGNIDSVPFDFSTINEYAVAISFIKKDDYSLFKKVVDKTPQIKIDGRDPQGESLLFLDSDGKPSFITIYELKTKLGIK
jgi:hypothetical protein